jgi:Mitochondrial ATP synthase B chain precursor (ATP-synt_B)
MFSLLIIPDHPQETAKLESENYVQQQKIAVAAELKSVLDSWVRYEQQVKEREQADLTKSVIDKVVASLKDEKTQREILASAVAEVEREFCLSLFLPNIFFLHGFSFPYSFCPYRTRQGQGYLNF